MCATISSGQFAEVDWYGFDAQVLDFFPVWEQVFFPLFSMSLITSISTFLGNTCSLRSLWRTFETFTVIMRLSATVRKFDE